MMTGSARWDVLCHGGQGLAEHGSVRHGVLWRFRFGVSRLGGQGMVGPVACVVVCGWDWSGVAVEVRYGRAWRGPVRFVLARRSGSVLVR